jgi:predicted O-methyltransferase YrrM
MSDQLTDWAYLVDFAERRAPAFFPSFFHLKDEAEALMTPRMNQHGPVTFHAHYYALLKMFATRAGRTLVIETGTRYGLSSFAACSALGFGHDGDVLTCDIMYDNHVEAQAKINELIGVDLYSGWDYHPDGSQAALPVFAKTDPIWNVFIHDSDHSAENMAWELDFAWEHIPAGGLLVCDDWDWPWKKENDDIFRVFAARVGKDFHTISTAAVIEK